MPPLDFPANPITGATYTGLNNVIWVWDGAKWVNGTQIGTAYAPISSPVFTGNPTAPNPPSGDADTSVATTAFVSAAVAPAFNGVGRNLLHNPLFAVAQRGTGPFSTLNTYNMDRWKVSGSTDTYTVILNTLADGHRAQIGDEEARVAFGNTFTGNAGAGAYHYLAQSIENVRRLAGKTVTISFWASAGATLKLGINLLQGFGTGGSPSAAAWVLGTGTAVTLSTALTRYSATIAIPSAGGKTLGTNGDDYTQLGLFFSSGSGVNATAGNIGVQSGSINIWGVQLEIGSVATPLEKPDPRYDLANCQRFYQTVAISGRAYFSLSNNWTLPVYWQPMRAVPTAALVTAGTVAGIVTSRGLGTVSAASGGLNSLVSGAGDAYVINDLWSLSADL